VLLNERSCAKLLRKPCYAVLLSKPIYTSWSTAQRPNIPLAECRTFPRGPPVRPGEILRFHHGTPCFWVGEPSSDMLRSKLVCFKKSKQHLMFIFHAYCLSSKEGGSWIKYSALNSFVVLLCMLFVYAHQVIAIFWSIKLSMRSKGPRKCLGEWKLCHNASRKCTHEKPEKKTEC